MPKLKWFSGGKERSETAIRLIKNFKNEIHNDRDKESLSRVLTQYLTELESKESSVPFILSRMNMDISNALKKDGCKLSSLQEKTLKELSSISHISYGY